MIGTQHFPGLWVDPVRQHTRRADHTLVRSICFVAGRIVSNPGFNNQARTGAAEVKCRHAETLRASSDRRFDLTQIKPLHSVARSHDNCREAGGSAQPKVRRGPGE
jgi:hypothetical protein